MMAILFAVLSIFPVSFIFFTMSERVIARHESRVGKEISFGNFVAQTWIDAWVQMKSVKSFSFWLLFASQSAVVLLLDLNVQYVIFIYLAMNGFMLVWFLPEHADPVVKMIEADRAQVRYAVATAVAILCLFACFTLSKSSNLSEVHWYWTSLLFVAPFQLAGMILFGEHPFQGLSDKRRWIESARFYVWSMLCVKMFLGGGDYFVDFHLKAAALYLFCRVAGIYFPKFHQRDLLRISVAYLFPITGLLWLSVLLLGVLELGANRV
jgi:hypothetical protein